MGNVLATERNFAQADLRVTLLCASQRALIC